MAIHTFSVASLKKVKNSVIGNPSAKVQLAQDELFVRTLIECLNPPPSSTLRDPQGSGSQDEIRIEAAHVISSLSYGSEEALAALLRSEAPHAFLHAIAHFTPADSTQLRSAFARALRALTVSIADVVGPSQWGLKTEKSTIRNEAKEALDYLFHIDSLDTYLPLLSPSSPTSTTQTSTSIAQLLGLAVRTPEHRKAITEWLPISDRQKEVKTRRGWEKTSTTNANAPTRLGGWVARHLVELVKTRDSKLQEAALLALAALSKENPTVASVLGKASPDRDTPPVLTSILQLTKSRLIDVQLAACLCTTHILRASSSNHSSPLDDMCIRTVMNIVNRMLAAGDAETPSNRTKACFILFYLITDDPALCYIAYERGCLEKLAALVQTVTPSDATEEWAEDEAESVSSLREAALTTISALSLFDNDIRRALTDTHNLLPSISTALTHPHPGVRYAACQCVRALSRAVAVLRTNIVDSGLGMVVFGMFKKDEEDRRVVGAALGAVCNIVNEFSPLRPIYLEQGLMPRLVHVLVSYGDPSLRLNALWAVKNLLRKTSTETKRDVMSSLEWKRLLDLLSDPDLAVQEQAFNILRNLAENEDGIDMIFREMGPEVLLDRVTLSLGSPAEAVVLQATYVLANLCNGTEAQQNLILSHPRLLPALRTCLAESKAEIRRPAVACVLELARTNPKRRKAIIDAGIVGTLRHLCEWSGAGVVPSSPVSVAGSPPGRSPVRSGSYGSWGGSAGGGMGGYVHHHGHHVHYGHGHYGHHHTGLEDDKDVVDQARMALDWLEHGDAYVS